MGWLAACIQGHARANTLEKEKRTGFLKDECSQGCRNVAAAAACLGRCNVAKGNHEGRKDREKEKRRVEKGNKFTDEFLTF